MMDFAKWSQRAVAFTEALRGFPDRRVEVGAPYTLERIRALCAECPLQIPDVLVNWYLSVGSCHCAYSLDIPIAFEDQMELVFPDGKKNVLWGGADLIDLPELVLMPKGCRAIAEGFQEHVASGIDAELGLEDPGATENDAKLWADSFPLIGENNGDYIGLYVGDSTIEPPVVYLCYTGCGACKVISPNFEEFLRMWEELRYIGCNFLVNPFINPTTGFLDSKFRADAVRALRRVYQGVRHVCL
jgi:hypothetical protein